MHSDSKLQIMDTRKTFTNRQVVAHYTNVSNRSEDSKKIIQFLLAELNLVTADVDDDSLSKLNLKVDNLLSQYDTKWKQANYTRERFERKNGDWLDSSFQVSLHSILLSSN